MIAQNPSVTRFTRTSACLLTVIATACGAASDTPVVTEARSQKQRAVAAAPAEDRAALADGNARFAVNLFTMSAEPGKNLVFSPTSISIALAMTYAGARGETETQMATALQFTLPQERLHPAMNAVDQELAERGQQARGADGGPFRLRMANALWAQKDGFTLEAAFLDVQAESYGAGVNLLDFAQAPEPARKAINAWVADKTDDRIEDLLAPGVIHSNTRLVLTNAIYLNAAWKTPFDADTRDGQFTLLDGTTVGVKMMGQQASLPAVEGADFQAVALPYEDERLSMLVLVPKQGSYDSFAASLTGDRLAEIVSSLQEQAVILSMPRFRVETPLSLAQTLSNLGMPIAFTGHADFSGISKTPLQIADVIHKAFIAVGEKGTEAAAATAVVLRATSAPTGLSIRVDRPFLFVLRDRPTGAILFMGRVIDPSKQ